MNFRLSILILLLCNLSLVTLAQDSSKVKSNSNIERYSLGFGLGMDYGGLGMNFQGYPVKNIGFFVGTGYAFAGIGYNVGVKTRLLPNKEIVRVVPNFYAMYGYNAAVVVQDNSKFNKFFYGPTIGIGLDFYPRPEKFRIGYWSIALLLPIRSSSLDSYVDDLKQNHNIEFKNDFIPIGLSIGYRIVL